MINRGLLPRANTVPCVDCGHVWKPGGRRHEYDHFLGYVDEQQEMVEPVCTTCHKQRTALRHKSAAFTAGYLAGIQQLKIADAWLAWVEQA